eukprot:COSAG05_NODE_4633_length_1431_cov_1.879129_1_plen_66_part_00
MIRVRFPFLCGGVYVAAGQPKLVLRADDARDQIPGRGPTTRGRRPRAAAAAAVMMGVCEVQLYQQ